MSSRALSPRTPIGIIGAGAMGAGIAQVAAAAGHAVHFLDARDGAAAQAIAGIQAQFDNMAAKGKMSAKAAQAASQRLHAAASMAELASMGLVVEAIVENLEVKRDLFRQLETVCSASCIFATNTSSISITSIAAGLNNPARLVGMHFFNPAPLMALVEIISGLATDVSVAGVLFDTAKAWGKIPVFAKSTPGFIVNRVARPFYAEGLRLLQEGAADSATIDAILRELGGFRMGPFELMDMIGHDVNFAVTQSVWRAFYNDPRFLPSLIQQELVEAGYLGKKTKRGFYNYAESASAPVAHTQATAPCPKDITVHGESRAATALVTRLANTGLKVHRAPAQQECLAQVDGVRIFQTDGRTATLRAQVTGVSQLVLCDVALNHDTATRMAISVAQQADASALQAATGLFQAAGYAVSCLRDVPGLAVMRTVAMLANEAADAVNQGVCDALSADTAMRLGVNYPRGPLAWADDIGVAHIHKVLKHLGDFYGEDRYRVSPLIQQSVYAGKPLHV
ncbi:3-hydroxyacyl-CoA dehydrogenase PaaH [Limnohabitans sp.]|uniref:3-hydroxyacyl-CoA dehydrogenase PaaH n=1 Tax=Limnohabitans sp. TaxID=1907725 RepID=UPI00286F8F2C|nr:3-hydroxyacyl-CoA dehydrogenase PaaH [Limnohabitans sp.]